MAKKKVKLKKGGKVLLLLIIIVVGALGVFCAKYSNKLSKKEEPKKVEKVKKEPVKVPKEYKVSLFMVGDALIHSAIYQDAKQADGSYDFKPMLEVIKPISSTYDLAYYNQETVLGGTELGLSNYPRFNSPYEVGDAFIDAGFNMVSLATNHTMDKGEVGVTNSVNYWKSKKDLVVYSGQWISAEEREAETAQVYEKNGIKYAFFSYTTWTNGLETPVDKEYLNNVYSDEKAAADIAKVKDKVDVIIVAMHWGNEYSLGISDKQVEIANYLSSLGVQIIIGAHPHVVEPVEYINDGKTFVIYSLGNFISDQEGNERLTGLMMSLNIKKVVDVDDSVTVTIEDPRAELIYTKSYRWPRNFKVYPYPQLTYELLGNKDTLYEKYKAIVSEKYPELVWGVTGSDLNGNPE
ncbi:MAG: CapA family protein [Bacilli bacterium]|nr:CapA family protein [Bacilli bacterium]